MTSDEKRLAQLLAAAEQISDGLCDLANAVYDLEPWTSDLLKAANSVAVTAQEVREAAEERAS